MDYESTGWRHSEDALRERDRSRDRELERMRKEHAMVLGRKEQQKNMDKTIENFEDRLQRMDDRDQNRDLIRRLMRVNQGYPNNGPGYMGPSYMRGRDDLYTGSELGRQIERERHGGYPNSHRNCLCDGYCDDGCIRRRSRRRYSSDPQQININGPVYVEGYDSESPYHNYDDWPPVDIYKKRWCGLLPDKRLPWVGDMVLDGSDVLRFSKRRRHRYSFGGPAYYH